MKKLAILFAGMFIMTIAVQNVNAQDDATGIAESNATIITPISIIKNVDLAFGNIVASGTDGTVVIGTDNSRNFTGGATAFANSTGDPLAAKFTVLGAVNATYSIVLTNTEFDLTRDGGTETMEVNTFVTSPDATGTLTGGTQEIFVGATLEVGANQEPGFYENTSDLEITVAYN
jgi:hypothetical protein